MQKPLRLNKVSKPAEAKSTKDYERSEFCPICLDPALMEYLRRLGGNDVSKGVEIAARFHQSLHGAER